MWQNTESLKISPLASHFATSSLFAKAGLGATVSAAAASRAAADLDMLIIGDEPEATRCARELDSA
jgi:hypothetical protein